MTTSSTWTCESPGAGVLGCGIDAELISRFRDVDPWHQLFTERELAHSRSLDDPALGLCASFCAKEALLKAVGVPIDYRDCELLFSPGGGEVQLSLAPSFYREHEIGGVVARVMLRASPDECIVVVCLSRRDHRRGSVGADDGIW